MDIIPPNTPQKQCSKCPNSYPATPEFFHRDKKHADGLRSECKPCHKLHQDAYYRTHQQDGGREWRQQHYQAHHDEIREKQKEYRQVQHDRILQQKREHYVQHQDEIRKKQKTYYDTHLDAIKKQQKRNRQQNPMRMRINGRIRDARKKSVGGKYTAQDLQDQYKRQKGKCYYCGIKLNGKYQADHVIPITREGSSNDPWNIVVACQSCNSRKRNRLPHEWPEGNRLL